MVGAPVGDEDGAMVGFRVGSLTGRCVSPFIVGSGVGSELGRTVGWPEIK